MEEKETLAEAVMSSLDWFRKAPLCRVKEWAIKLGREAYRLKACGEVNAAYFAASHALGAAAHAQSAVKHAFIWGWGQQKADMGGFPEQVDLPKHLLGYSHIPQEAYEQLGQK